MNEDVYVVGYPKSGNTWVSRLLGDVLDSPVIGYKNATPIATEGKDRKGGYNVRQLHLKPIGTGSKFIEDPYRASPRAYNGERIVFVIRDPRDVCISAMYYWQIKSLKKALMCVGEGIWPLSGIGAWSMFVNMWYDHDIIRNGRSCVVYYELLLAAPSLLLWNILDGLGLPHADAIKIDKAVERQEFNTKRKQLEKDGDSRPYGRDVQLRNLRLGTAGDWKNHFDAEARAMAANYFGKDLIKLGYERNSDWIKEQEET